MTQPGQSVEDLREDAWTGALHAFGTGYLFERRAHAYKRLLRLQAFVGIALPALIGAAALGGVALSSPVMRVSVMVAGGLGIPIIAVNAWALVANWADNFSAASQSESANYELSDAYERLAKYPPASTREFHQQMQLLTARDDAQRDRDRGQQPTEAEKRRGMRAALRKRQKECAECHKVPTTMKPTDCGVCGDFPNQPWRR